MKTDAIGSIIKRCSAIVSTAAVICILLLILVSWVITSAHPDLPLRSMLSGEGIRWFVGHAAHNLANPIGAWLLLASFTYGAVRASHVCEVFNGKKMTYRKRFALRMMLIEISVVCVVFILLTMPPHAILLGVTGQLTTGSFLHGLIPVVLLSLTLFSLTYGLVSGAIRNLTEVFCALAAGVKSFAHFFVMYVFVAELFSVGIT